MKGMEFPEKLPNKIKPINNSAKEMPDEILNYTHLANNNED